MHAGEELLGLLLVNYLNFTLLLSILTKVRLSLSPMLNDLIESEREEEKERALGKTHARLVDSKVFAA
jgi:hypothetical protein